MSRPLRFPVATAAAGARAGVGAVEACAAGFGGAGASSAASTSAGSTFPSVSAAASSTSARASSINCWERCFASRGEKPAFSRQNRCPGHRAGPRMQRKTSNFRPPLRGYDKKGAPKRS